MIISEQIRAARAILRIEQADLAARAGVSLGTVKRLEGVGGTASAQESTLASIQRALEAAGVIFIEDEEAAPKGGPGVRLVETAAADRWNAQVETILDTLVESLQMSLEDRGIDHEGIADAIEAARESAAAKLERTVRDSNTEDLFDKAEIVEQVRTANVAGNKAVRIPRDVAQRLMQDDETE